MRKRILRVFLALAVFILLFSLSVRADEALASLGLSRSACTDLYDEDLRVHRRVMRYRALCDENGVLTQ